MAEQLDAFLAKIQKDAVDKAAAEAQEKLTKAEAEAAKIVSEAEAKAEKIVAEAETKAARFAENGEKTLKFAARDLLIYTRQELENLLNKVFAEKAKDILTLDEVKPLVLKLLAAKEGEALVEVPADTDVEKIEKYFLNELSEKAKAGVKIAPVKGLKAGFNVVFSGSDLKVELNDATLVELLSSQLAPKLAAILKD